MESDRARDIGHVAMIAQPVNTETDRNLKAIQSELANLTVVLKQLIERNGQNFRGKKFSNRRASLFESVENRSVINAVTSDTDRTCFNCGCLGYFARTIDHTIQLKFPTSITERIKAITKFEVITKTREATVAEIGPSQIPAIHSNPNSE